MPPFPKPPQMLLEEGGNYPGVAICAMRKCLIGWSVKYDKNY